MSEHSAAAADLLERIGYLARTGEQVAGLYPAQWAALRYLARANRFSRTPMALSRYLGSTRGTISQTLKALERKSYIRRKASVRDRRAVELELSAEGVARLESDPIAQLAARIEQTLGDEAARLGVMLRSVLADFVEQNGGRIFGECRTCRFFEKGKGENAGLPHRCGLLKESLSNNDSLEICAEHEASGFHRG